MIIQINAQDGTPIYQQIVDQVKYLVAAGRMQAGDEMPPIRVLADDLTINPNTVARAYLELERAGVVYKRQGSGTYIAEVHSVLSRREKVKVLTKRADSLLTDALHLGVEFDDVVELLRDRHETLKSQSTP